MENQRCRAGYVQTSCHHECFGASLNPLPNLASRSTICIDFNDTNLEQTHWSTLPGCDKESEIVQPFQSSHSPPKLVLKTGIKKSVNSVDRVSKLPRPCSQCRNICKQDTDELHRNELASWSSKQQGKASAPNLPIKVGFQGQHLHLPSWRN